ncbi:MAG: LD-carboxypeptidase, partial [Clostridiales bacterium]|nr:LD-carboxypeptidase [Clostridiales bacterium]
MKDLTVPERLRPGDTVAFISISGGRAGDPDMTGRYETAKARFEEAYGVSVVETPCALRGKDFLYSHPEQRAADLVWALEDPDIKGIICNMGGDDSYRVLPFIDPRIISDHPKVFMGYSDIATWMAVFAHAGVRAFYGPNVLTPIGQPGSFDAYSKEAVRRALFSGEVIGQVSPAEAWTPIEWKSGIRPEEIIWTKGEGYSVVQGSGAVQGRLFVLCPGPLQQIMGTKYYPEKEFFDGAVLAIEHGQPYGSA